jgi:hypothetical protein
MSEIAGGPCNWIISVHVGEICLSLGHYPASLFYLTTVHSNSQATRAVHQIPPLPCPSGGDLGTQHLSAYYVLWDPDITKDGRLHLPRCVCVVSAPSSFLPQSLLLPVWDKKQHRRHWFHSFIEEASMWVVHKGKTETGERHAGVSWRIHLTGVLVFQGQSCLLSIRAIQRSHVN